MSRSHNKKRNVGIIYEQLLRTMATSLVSDNNKKYKATLGIVRKHFSPGTQLYKEFRLFNAMIKTTVDKESLATRILKEAKSAALDFDSEQLRKEKAALIKDINYTISDSTFYNQRINEYRKYATIQTLLNDWRSSGKAPLSRVADYENKVCNFLLTESKEEPIHVLKDEDISSLTVRIMTEKFNNKYGRQLNDEQQAIIKEYVFSTETGQTTNFSAYLSELKESLITELEMYSSVCDNIILNEKMNKVTSGVSSLDPGQVNDETVSRFLLVSQLKEEIIGADNE